MMTIKEVRALAERINDMGNNLELRDWLSALGMVVTDALQQYPEAEERLAATVSWVATLTEAMLKQYIAQKIN